MRYFAVILVFLAGVGLGRALWPSSDTDALNTAQAQVLIPDPPATGLGLRPSLSEEWRSIVSDGASTAQTLLKKIPDFVLRKAYEERLQAREAQTKDQFSALGLTSDLERFYDFFKAHEGVWEGRKKRAVGSSWISLKNESRRVQFFVEMFPQGSGPSGIKPSMGTTKNVMDPNDVCFMAEVIVEKVSRPIGLGQCASLIWQAADHHYFMVIPINVDEMEPEWTQFALELPIGGPGDLEFKAFDSDEGRWKKLAPVQWQFLGFDSWSVRRSEAFEAILSAR